MAETPAEGAVAAPAAGVAAKAEEVQPEPSLAGDAAGAASDTSESETEDKAGFGEVEEEEDLFASGTDEDRDAGNRGANNAPANMAGYQEEDIFVFPDEGLPPPVAPSL